MQHLVIISLGGLTSASGTDVSVGRKNSFKNYVMATRLQKRCQEVM
jgi:ABC-type glucose/galactose transport system permease subunit